MSLVERSKCLNSLVCLLQGLQGHITTIELRNECSVTGRIDQVDSAMNTHLSDATFKTVHGDITQFNYLFIQGRNVRYVHIPDRFDPVKVVTQQVQTTLNIRNHTERKEKKLSKWNKQLNEQRAEKRKQEIASLAAKNVEDMKGKAND